MTNTQHTNENLTVHFKVKDFKRTDYNGNEKNVSRQESRMDGCSTAPTIRMMW